MTLTAEPLTPVLPHPHRPGRPSPSRPSSALSARRCPLPRDDQRTGLPLRHVPGEPHCRPHQRALARSLVTLSAGLASWPPTSFPQCTPRSPGAEPLVGPHTFQARALPLNSRPARAANPRHLEQAPSEIYDGAGALPAPPPPPSPSSEVTAAVPPPLILAGTRSPHVATPTASALVLAHLGLLLIHTSQVHLSSATLSAV